MPPREGRIYRKALADTRILPYSCCYYAPTETSPEGKLAGHACLPHTKLGVTMWIWGVGMPKLATHQHNEHGSSGTSLLHFVGCRMFLCLEVSIIISFSVQRIFVDIVRILKNILGGRKGYRAWLVVFCLFCNHPSSGGGGGGIFKSHPKMAQ